VRVLILEPYPGWRWVSITRYADGLDDVLSTAGVCVRRAYAPWWNPQSLVRGLRHRWWCSPELARARAGEFDLVHIADQALAHHALGFRGRARVVVTVHDLLPWTLPGYYRGPLKQLRGFLIRKSLASIAHADGVVTPSEFSRGHLLERTPVRPERAQVVPNPVNAQFVPIARWEAESRLRDLGIALPPGPRVLSVGHAGTYKNLPALIAALQRPALGRHSLVRVGALLSKRQSRELKSMRLAGRVVELGRIPDDVLRLVYASCDVLVQPSLAEGFGYPVVEAMRMGLPVVTSDGGALPETGGGAALVVPLASADFPGALAEAIEAVTQSPELAERLRAAGTEWSARFSPVQVGKRLLDAYAAIA
jgi:glycosyltransferase involved in cell wall biosynthesis